MHTGITDIEQAVESLMEHVYVDGHQTDFTVQTIEANPPLRGDDSVALYMGMNVPGISPINGSWTRRMCG